MQKIRIKAPAKINLTLEILSKRPDGFHNIQSIMQTISLYDYITIKNTNKTGKIIKLTGTSNEIPYNEKNLVYKATELFLKYTQINNYCLEIHIEKHIPIAAGLAGGSTDAAATILGLNKLFKTNLSNITLHQLCSKLGSDLNVCLEGGCILALQRGEKIKKLPFTNKTVSLIKPKNLGISAKEAYIKYAQKPNLQDKNKTISMITAFNQKEDFTQFLYNDLEYAIIDDYQELQNIKTKIPNSIMSGSGSTFFVLDNKITNFNSETHEIINNLKFTPKGIEIEELFS